MSFLNVIGADIKAVFNWLGSAKGQAKIAAGEAVVESIYPPADGVLTLANTWLTEIIKAEALGAAAGSAPGSDTTKAAMVIAAVTPQVVSFAQANTKLVSAPTAAKLQAANDALVTFLEAIGGTAAAPVATT